MWHETHTLESNEWGWVPHCCTVKLTTTKISILIMWQKKAYKIGEWKLQKTVYIMKLFSLCHKEMKSLLKYYILHTNHPMFTQHLSNSWTPDFCGCILIGILFRLPKFLVNILENSKFWKAVADSGCVFSSVCGGGEGGCWLIGWLVFVKFGALLYLQERNFIYYVSVWTPCFGNPRDLNISLALIIIINLTVSYFNLLLVLTKTDSNNMRQNSSWGLHHHL